MAHAFNCSFEYDAVRNSHTLLLVMITRHDRGDRLSGPNVLELYQGTDVPILRGTFVQFEVHSYP